MNDAEYSDRAEDGVISRGQNDTSSWEVTYDPDFTDRVFEAVNYMSDVQDSVDHYRMHLRHYQEEVVGLKSKATHYETMYALAKDESDKLRLQNAEMRESLRQLRNSAERYHEDSIGFQPTTEDIQERQARVEIDPLIKSREPYGKVPVSYVPPGIKEFEPLADITREWSPRSHYEDKE